MIFVQPFCDNSFFHTHVMFLSSLFFFLSPLFLTEKAKKEIVMIVVKNGC